MIDMKLTPEQSQTMTILDMQEAQNIETVGAYPEGLKIELEGEVLKRLAIGEGNLPQVGQKFMLCAMVEVIEVGKEQGTMDTELCVELQIQQMELNAPEQMNEQQAAYNQINKMYG